MSLLIAAFIVAGSIYMALSCLVDLTRALRSSSWPSVTGTVLTSIVAEYGAESDYIASVTYQYDVHGSMQVSKRVFFGDNVGEWERSKAMGFVDKYQPERQISVYYDKNNPKVAVLEPGVKSGLLGKTTVAVIMSLFICGFLFEVIFLNA